jgi:hypothetical protein
MIKEALEQRIQMMSAMNHPALLEMFVVRNGVVFKGGKRPKGIRKRENKMCFQNATRITTELDGYEYYEGFGINKNLGIHMHHAWNTKDNVLIDSTWKDPENCEYMGVHFPIDLLRKQLVKTGYYGLLSNDITYNFELIFEMDPELKIEFERSIGRKFNW